MPLEGGRFATSDLNDLYRRVINRNNRLKKLMDIRAPEVILRNEKRMLQEAVDALFDNGRRSRAVRGQGNRPLKSLSDMLKGKQGRFRQNLLGKRVDYSGRSVIVVGPELKLNQCGLPKNMALELFKPFIIRKLEDRGYVQTVKSAKRLVEREKPEVWDILGEIIENHPVLLNRAPTLHRLGIQGFEPVLVEGKAIRIHPLVCSAFNADFDGDQMAVHVPLSFEAQIETSLLMLSTHNILSPAHGRPLATPSQDIVLGCHYLTKPRGEIAQPARRGGRARARTIRAGCARSTARSRCAPPTTRRDHRSTAGSRCARPAIVAGAVAGGRLRRDHRRAACSSTRSCPQELGFINETMDKKRLENLVGDCYSRLGAEITSDLLDELKNLGFQFATQAGFTVGIDDVRIPPEKDEIIDRARKEVDQINANYRQRRDHRGRALQPASSTPGRTPPPRSSRSRSTASRKDRDGFNPIFMMADSGSRGNREQVRQLAGMRGLMAKPQKKITGGLGEIIESPVIHNFKEGLTVLEYFISTHGARKGLADTALKTADAGYLTRRLVDVAQDVIINEPDCGTIRGLSVGALKDGEDIIEPLADRVLGRVAAEDVIHPISNEMIVEAGQLDRRGDRGAHRGGGQGRAREDPHPLGAHLRRAARRVRQVLRAQPRDRPSGGPRRGGRRHRGAVDRRAGHAAHAAHLPHRRRRRPHRRAVADHGQGRRARCASSTLEVGAVPRRHAGRGRPPGRDRAASTRPGRVRQRYNVPYGAHLFVNDGAAGRRPISRCSSGTSTTSRSSPRSSGTVRFVDVKEKVTVRDEVDDTTGLKLLVIMEDRNKELQPAIDILEHRRDRSSRTTRCRPARVSRCATARR